MNRTAAENQGPDTNAKQNNEVTPERDWRTMGIVELAVENQSVADYIQHWEHRALTAEAEIIERACGQDAWPGKLEHPDSLDATTESELLAMAASWVKRHGGFGPDLLETLRRVYLLGRERSCGETAWVSVSERLPERFEQVLVLMKPVPEGPDWYPRTNIQLAWQKKGSWFGSFVDMMTGEVKNGEFPDDLVTHWQPLPSPPTGRTEEK